MTVPKVKDIDCTKFELFSAQKREINSDEISNRCSVYDRPPNNEERISDEINRCSVDDRPPKCTNE